MAMREPRSWRIESSGRVARLRDRAILAEKHLAGDECLGRKKPHDRERGDGFSGARFANQAKDFTGSDGEVEVADGAEGLFGSSNRRLFNRLLGGRKLYVEIADVKKRGHRFMLAAKSRPAGDGQPRAAVPTLRPVSHTGMYCRNNPWRGLNLGALLPHLLC